MVDENGSKLSKRLNNYPAPDEVWTKYGADALRWFLVSSPILRGQNLVMDRDGSGIDSSLRQVIVPLWNSVYFFTLYCNLEDYNPKIINDADLPIDKYILLYMNIPGEEMSKAKDNDKLFSEYSDTINALQWHSYEVSELDSNKNVTILGSSKTTKYQIFKYMEHAYGIQFHIEIKDNTVNQWSCVPEYEKALEDSLGSGALENFDKKAKMYMKEMNLSAEILYKNFKKII